MFVSKSHDLWVPQVSILRPGKQQIHTVTERALLILKLDELGLFLALFFWPKWRLNDAKSLVLQVRQNPRPIHNAALRPRQPLLRFFELALGEAQTRASGAVELSVCGHTGVQIDKSSVLFLIFAV